MAEYEPTKVAATYDTYYRRRNFYRYNPFLYKRYMRALAKRAGLREGCRVLDAGCGQGFFSALLAAEGFNVTGIDLSAEGIRTAQTEYGASTVRFEVGDCLSMPYAAEFDCVFTRSCSLYNAADLELCHHVTKALLGYIRPGGTLIVDYNSRLRDSATETAWIHHSLETIRLHFAAKYSANVYFSSRIDTLLLGCVAFTVPVTRLNVALNRMTGLGGEIVAIVQKDRE